LIANQQKNFTKGCSKFSFKQIFARWQASLSAFDFEIEFIKGIHNFLLDTLTREFLEGKSDINISLQEQP